MLPFDLTPQQFLEDISKPENTNNITILDVRRPDEFQQGHIPNALNINIQDSDFLDRIEELPKDKTYYVYCRSGGRSANACMQLQSLGFENYKNLMGGILAWEGEVVIG